MLKSYEAVYSHGHLRWVHQTPPNIAKEMRVIVVLDAAPQYQEEYDRERVHVLLQRTRGALGRGKTLQEIDRGFAHIDHVIVEMLKCPNGLLLLGRSLLFRSIPAIH